MYLPDAFVALRVCVCFTDKSSLFVGLLRRRSPALIVVDSLVNRLQDSYLVFLYVECLFGLNHTLPVAGGGAAASCIVCQQLRLYAFFMCFRGALNTGRAEEVVVAQTKRKG